MQLAMKPTLKAIASRAVAHALLCAQTLCLRVQLTPAASRCPVLLDFCNASYHFLFLISFLAQTPLGLAVSLWE